MLVTRPSRPKIGVAIVCSLAGGELTGEVTWLVAHLYFDLVSVRVAADVDQGPLVCPWG
jgi:hypothetical protein